MEGILTDNLLNLNLNSFKVLTRPCLSLITTSHYNCYRGCEFELSGVS